MSLSHKAILETANAAISRGDYEGFLQYCTDDTVWHFVSEQTLEGKDAVREYMAATYQAPPKFSVDTLIAEDDFVTALGTITLLSAAGKEEDFLYCDVWQFREGKLAELRAFVIPEKA